MGATWALGSAANLLLGLCLFTFALASWRPGPGRGSDRWFAVFVGLVGTNYLLGGAVGVLDDGHPVDRAIFRLAFVANYFDPAAFLLFALHASGRPVPPRWAPLLFLPGALLVLASGGLAPTGGWRPAYALMVSAAYVASLLLLTASFLRRPGERADLGVLVVALAPVALARVPIAYSDALGLTTFDRARPEALIMDAALALTALGYVAFCRRVAAPRDRRRADSLARSAVSLLLVVEVVWILRFVPHGLPAMLLFFSIRWYLFLAVLVAHARRGILARVPTPFTKALLRTSRALFLGAAVMVAAVAISDVMASASTRFALAGGALVVGLGVGTVRALRFATTPLEAAVDSREAAMYRARVLLGAPEPELEAARVELRLTRGHAARVRELAELERDASGRVGPESLAPGTLLAGRYRVERLEGAGAFGRVLAAVDVRAGERVTIKELREEWHGNPAGLARFRNEAEALTRVSHPNLVRLLAVEPVRGGFVLVLEHVPGTTLHERMAAGGLSAEETRRTAEDLLAALEALHARGIVHRDVKPSNVVLTPEGRAVLLDLGSATAQGSGTVAGEVPGGLGPGTIAYMSPEQLGRREVGPSSDLYSLGLVLAEVLRSARGPVPPGWGDLLARAMRPAPSERWPDAAAFRDALP